ncbi:adenine phosphoribosyltransferase [Tulasnella sp. 427]|nr:adenine phosphoribosyltransferase [Tulasnella sp. 427]
MPREPNYQHLPYVPDYERRLWEVMVDHVFPPVRFPDGRRFDDDYLERFWFHAFGVGGPLAGEGNQYPPYYLWKIFDTRDAIAEECARYRENVRAKWESYKAAWSSRLNRVSGWLASKTGWTTRWKPLLRRSKILTLCGVELEEDYEEIERQFYESIRHTPLNDDSQRYPYFGFTPSPTPPTERTRLLQHAAGYSAISPKNQDDDDDDGENEFPIPSSPPKGGKPPSALSSKRGVFRKLRILRFKSKRPKAVRFTNINNVLVFDKFPWEPTGCYKGIVFLDMFPVLRDPVAFEVLITHLVHHITSSASLGNGVKRVDVVVGLDARGFLLGPIIALRLGAAFVPVRKKGKLPGECVTATYEKEYGSDSFDMQADAITPGQKVVIIDDLIATGGSAKAAGELVKKLGGHILEYVFIVGLTFLKGHEQLDAPVYSMIEVAD